MPSVRRTATLLPMFAVFVVAGVAPTPGVARAESLGAATPQGSSAIEASLVLDQATRRLIQQGLRDANFDPGPPNGLFGPRTGAATRGWQPRRTRPTGYLNAAGADLLRTAAATPPAPSTPPQATPAGAASTSSAAARPASEPLKTDSGPAPATVTTRVVPQNARETHTPQQTRLPPEILIDRHLLRADRLLADGEPAAALEEMNEVLALQEAHDLVLEVDFHFQYAQVAFAAERMATAIASLNTYLVAAGHDAGFYQDALELLDSAEVRLEREDAERTRLARWPPGHVFRDCALCPEMVVMPRSLLALGRYEVTVGEYRAFASSTDGGSRGARNCYGGGSWRDPGYPQTDRHPVVCVSWDDAQEYVSWLSRTTELSYRLPTEAEWQQPAAGSQPGCDQLGSRTRQRGTCPVGSHGSNAAGLSDMVGNVWEWTADCWDGDCGRRVVRGGSWFAGAEFLRPGARHRDATGFRVHNSGFRVLRMLE